MRPVLSRRAWIAATAAIACSRTDPASGSTPPALAAATETHMVEWNMGMQSWGEARAAIVVPTWGGPDARFPVLVAFHGRGEALKPPSEGALGWPRDYAMVRAMDRLRAPPLADADYQGLADGPRLAAANASLATQPFGGLIVVCPWLPDFHPVATVDIDAYRRFVLDSLLPRVRRETPALSTSDSTGIDGVSLGGVIALRIGLGAAESFGAVGAIQPALLDGQTAKWTALAQQARARRPALRLRLLTSHDDYFRGPIVAVSQAWRSAGVVHDFAEVTGPHDYVFNRGPGSIELLMWHDRALSHA